MVDINATAVKLSNENLSKNNVQRSARAWVSNGFEKVDEMYDFIVTNPPIKTGKKLLFELMDGAYKHLKEMNKQEKVLAKLVAKKEQIALKREQQREKIYSQWQ